jgi:hypothetical protein
MGLDVRAQFHRQFFGTLLRAPQIGFRDAAVDYNSGRVQILYAHFPTSLFLLS